MSFRAANVSDDMARAAAEQVASHESDIADFNSDSKLLKRMVGAVLPLEIMQFARVFIPQDVLLAIPAVGCPRA
jgi:hypothetical protein